MATSPEATLQSVERDLRRALEAAILTVDELRLTANDARLRLPRIDWSGTLEAVCGRLAAEAGRQGPDAVSRVVDATLERLEEGAPGRPALLAIKEARQWLNSPAQTLTHNSGQSPAARELRPDNGFDVKRFCEKRLNRSDRPMISFQLQRSKPPRNVFIGPPYDLGKPEDAFRSSETWEAVTTLSMTCPGEWVLLIGEGGAGKSTLLRQTEAHLAARPLEEDVPLPVLVPLSRYGGDLKLLISQILDLPDDKWSNLAKPLLLLCDGLNEVPVERLQPLMKDLADLQCLRLGVVISLKTTGLGIPTRLPSVPTVYKIKALTTRQIEDFARWRLDRDRALMFTESLVTWLSAGGDSLLSLAFGVSTALETYKKTGKLTATRAELIEELLKQRLEHSRTNPASPSCTTRPVENSTLRAVWQSLMYRALLLKPSVELEQHELERLINRVLSDLKSRHEDQSVFGIDGLSDTDALQAIVHHELLLYAGDGWWSQHQLVAGYLAAPELARGWRNHSEQLAEVICDDALLFAASHLKGDELRDYLKRIAQYNLLLATECAIEAGAEAKAAVLPLIEQQGNLGRRLPLAASAQALALLNDSEAVARLHERLEPDNPKSHASASAAAALAMAGDEEFLRQQLVFSNRGQRNFLPYNQWELAWTLAPAHLALRLARERLRQYPSKLSLPIVLDVIATYGDASDFELLQSYFCRMEFGPPVEESLESLYALDLERAHREISPIVAASPNLSKRLQCYEVMLRFGEEVDASWMLSLALREPLQQGPSPDEPAYPHPYGKPDVVELLSRIKPSAELKKRVLDKYEMASEWTRTRLWELATYWRIEGYRPFAREIIQQDLSGEFSFAVRYAMTQKWTEDEHKQITERLVHLITQSRRETSPWTVQTILDFLIETGSVEIATSVVEQQARDLVSSYSTLKGGARLNSGPGGPTVELAQSPWRMRYDLFSQAWLDEPRGLQGI